MHAPIIQPQDSTAVELPDVSAQALQAIVQTMLAQEPQGTKRIRAGLETLLASRIIPTAECGVYLVESSEHCGQFYRASSYTCCCKDATHRGPGCRHSRAITILICAIGEAAAERQMRDYAARRAALRPVGA